MNSEVVILRCRGYNRKKVFDAVTHAFELLGGLSKYVQPGQKVLLKPNMLSAKKPSKAVTTHPIVLEAVIELVKSVGGVVWVGDSPSGAIKGVKRCWENTGFLEVAEKTGVKLINFEAGGTVLKKVNGKNFHIAKAVLEADVVINLPKFKTHGLTLYTGAIKNLFGTLPGFQKAEFHKLYPHPQSFSECLVDILSIVKPSLHLMDAILGMEGDGPATGDKRKTGLILASEDAVALDSVASFLMGFKENEIDVVSIAGIRGLGENTLSRINILGESLNSAQIPDFSLPSNRLIKLVPEFLMKWVGKFIWVRPESKKELCTGCKICAESCPVYAIEMKDGHPVFDYGTCINCLCCNESCPESAIVQKLSWLAKRIG